MRLRAAALAVLLVVSTVGMVTAPAAASQEAQGEAYAGAYVEFQTQSNAVADYEVTGDVLVENVTMQSSDEAYAAAGVQGEAGMESMTNVQGASVESYSEASASAQVEFGSGGTMDAHDNQRGIAQFHAESGDQFVQANLSSDSDARAVSDERVVVEREDGTDAVFIVVGNGSVAVNEEGNVNADIAEGSQLVYRQYDGERSDSDDEAEEMIANGTATAEVFVQESSESGQETAAQTVEYGQDTTVEVTSTTRSTVEMTAERTKSEGTVILTTVSEQAFDNAEDIRLTVDGEAAAEVNSYGEVQGAVGGNEVRYLVRQSASMESTTEVLIGVDHFSERNVKMTSEDTATPTEDGSDDTSSDEMATDTDTATATDSATESGGDTGGDASGGDSDDTEAGSQSDGPGFGVVAALVALVGAMLAARRR